VVSAASRTIFMAMATATVAAGSAGP
jgi:hypothetical protein